MKQKLPEIADYELELIKIEYEAPNVKTFRFKIPEGTDIDFKAGQFFMVRFKDGPKLQRAYSISSSPTDKTYLEITLNLVGEFTHKIFNAKIGDKLIFKGPFGKFYFEESMKNNLVLICGGTGITPMRDLIRLCTAKKLPNKIKLIYSVRSSDLIIYHDEFDGYKEKNHNFDFIVTVSDPKPELNWKGYTGRINEEMLKEHIEDIEGSIYFICGPIPMVKAMVGILESFGVKKEQIETDMWEH